MRAESIWELLEVDHTLVASWICDQRNLELFSRPFREGRDSWIWNSRESWCHYELCITNKHSAVAVFAGRFGVSTQLQVCPAWETDSSVSCPSKRLKLTFALIGVEVETSCLGFRGSDFRTWVCSRKLDFITWVLFPVESLWIPSSRLPSSFETPERPPGAAVLSWQPVHNLTEADDVRVKLDGGKTNYNLETNRNHYRTGDRVCPVESVIQLFQKFPKRYLCDCEAAEPFFWTPSGEGVQREAIQMLLKEAACQCGVGGTIGSHSLRFGGARALWTAFKARMRPLCEDSGVGRATHSTPTYGKTGSILVEWQHLCCALTSHRPDVPILCHGGPVPPGSEARGGRGMRPRGKDLFNPFGKDLFSPFARKKHAWARSDSFDSREPKRPKL